LYYKAAEPEVQAPEGKAVSPAASGGRAEPREELRWPPALEAEPLARGEEGQLSWKPVDAVVRRDGATRRVAGIEAQAQKLNGLVRRLAPRTSPSSPQ